MPAKTIDLNSKPIVQGAPTVRVYTKSSWVSAWTLNERLMVQEAVWATARHLGATHGLALDRGNGKRAFCKQVADFNALEPVLTER